jgi:hypothetical protein
MVRRSACFALPLLVLAMVLAWTGLSGAENAIRYTNASAAPGDTVEIEVIMENDVTISGVVVPFRWSSPDLHLVSITIDRSRFRGAIADTTFLIDQEARTGGIFFVNDIGDTGYVDPGSGVLARVRFAVSSDAQPQFVFVDSVYEGVGSGEHYTLFSDFSGYDVIFPEVYAGTITIGSPPTEAGILTNPQALAFTGDQFGEDPPSQTLSVRTNNGTVIPYEATWQSDWLSMTPPFGNTPAEPLVRTTIGGLESGIYFDTILISSTGAANSPVEIPVSFEVTKPEIDLLTVPADVSLQGFVPGATELEETVSVNSNLTVPVQWEASWGTFWLSVSPSNGTTPTTMFVTADVSELDIGQYYDTILITAPEAENSPLTVPITVVLEEAGAAERAKIRRLDQNHPNPLNLYRQGSTNIGFYLGEADMVEITLYDMLGRHVRTLLSRVMGKGDQSIQWDGRDRHGNLVPSGHYFYSMKTSRGTVTKRMTVIK